MNLLLEQGSELQGIWIRTVVLIVPRWNPSKGLWSVRDNGMKSGIETGGIGIETVLEYATMTDWDRNWDGNYDETRDRRLDEAEYIWKIFEKNLFNFKNA